MSADDFVLDISNVPIPPEEVVESVSDEFASGDPAFKMCFLGLGQGGGRIAHQLFAKRSKRFRVVIESDWATLRSRLHAGLRSDACRNSLSQYLVADLSVSASSFLGPR